MLVVFSLLQVYISKKEGGGSIMADALHLDAVGQKQQHSKAKRIALEIFAIILMLVVLSPL